MALGDKQIWVLGEPRLSNDGLTSIWVLGESYVVWGITEEAPAGWTHNFLGVANASIGKINGIEIASILKVNGVE